MADKSMVGYCEPFSVEAGERVRLCFSADVGDGRPLDLALVRLRCGDPYTGFDEALIADSGLPSRLNARHQPLRPGSSVEITGPALDSALARLARLEIVVRAYPTLPSRGVNQALIAAEGFSLEIDGDGLLVLRVGDTTLRSKRALDRNRWVEITAVCDPAVGMHLHQLPLPTRSPAAALTVPDEVSGQAPSALPGLRGPLYFGARGAGTWTGTEAHYDGRLEAPRIEGVGAWDFAVGIGTRAVHDSGPLGLHGTTQQTPSRAVTSSTWDGSTQRWSDDPTQWAAIHFHHDDLSDAAWQTDAAFAVPAELATGIYCFRITDPATGEIDRSPFVVRPAAAQALRSPVLFLVPTATYLAYANHHMTIDGADFFPSRKNLRPEFAYLRDHPELGLSMYESHADGSGVMYSSMRRPVLNLKPGADGWAFTADTNLVAFLEREGLGYDVMTDEDLHRDGAAALANYQVVVTGSHPEYTSSAMLDAFEQYLSAGGRLMYLGGNGFYWRVAFSDDQPGVMEVRRAEDGTRGWIAEPGEYYHEWGGEYGGLWRRLGRAPNMLVGIGFAAQGFDRAAPFKRTPASFDSRAAWVFDGVRSDDLVGDYGVGRGAAGQEIDRFDERLGSPGHAVVLAYADDHSEQMLRTKEELLATRMPGPDSKIRADMVFFETPNGGGVFSVGSIAWYGALSHDGYDNDISRITHNVLHRFADPTPLPPPES